jgi:hypothetical protein
MDINGVLERVLAREPRIDVLKVDTEGAEADTIGAIRPDLLERIDTIYFETTDRPVLHADRFDTTFACDTARLVNRGSAPVRRDDALERGVEREPGAVGGEPVGRRAS